MSRGIMMPLMHFFRFIHAWVGVFLSLLIFFISLSGSLLVWKEDYLKFTIPEARQFFEPTPVSLARIGHAIDEHFDGNQIYSVQFASTEFPLTYLVMADNQYAYLDVEGNIVALWQGNARLEEWLYDFHHRLLLNDLGLLIVGFGGMAMFVLIFFGLIAFWPTRRGWRFGVIPKDASRIQLLKAHRNVGVVLALPFMVTLMTGIVLVFPSETEDFLLEDLRRTEEYSMAMVEELDMIYGGDSGQWLPAMQRASAVFPSATIRSAQVPGNFLPYRIIGMQQEGEVNRNGLSLVYIDAQEGYMDIRMDAQNYPLIERTYNMLYPLHTGKMNQLWYKLYLSMLGLTIMLISGLGLTSFIKRYLKM